MKVGRRLWEGGEEVMGGGEVMGRWEEVMGRWGDYGEVGRWEVMGRWGGGYGKVGRLWEDSMHPYLILTHLPLSHLLPSLSPEHPSSGINVDSDLIWAKLLSFKDARSAARVVSS